MKLDIHSIHNHGDQRQERIVLRASEDCQLHRYMVADSTYIDEKTVSNKLRHTHWFLNAPLKTGDWVILYTGKGQDNTSRTKDGYTVHHRYWGLDRAVWNDTGDDAQLFELSHWTHRRVK